MAHYERSFESTTERCWSWNQTQNIMIHHGLLLNCQFTNYKQSSEQYVQPKKKQSTNLTDPTPAASTIQGCALFTQFLGLQIVRMQQCELTSIKSTCCWSILCIMEWLITDRCEFACSLKFVIVCGAILKFEGTQTLILTMCHQLKAPINSTRECQTICRCSQQT